MNILTKAQAIHNAKQLSLLRMIKKKMKLKAAVIIVVIACNYNAYTRMNFLLLSCLILQNQSFKM